MFDKMQRMLQTNDSNYINPKPSFTWRPKLGSCVQNNIVIRQLGKLAMSILANSELVNN